MKIYDKIQFEISIKGENAVFINEHLFINYLENL